MFTFLDSFNTISLPIILGPTPPPLPTPTLHITPSESEHFAGESIDIACHSSEPGAITVWSKVQGWMANNVQNVGGTLRIRNLRPENSGTYRCEANGRSGVYHKDFELNVIGMTYFSKYLKLKLHVTIFPVFR